MPISRFCNGAPKKTSTTAGSVPKSKATSRVEMLETPLYFRRSPYFLNVEVRPVSDILTESKSLTKRQAVLKRKAENIDSQFDMLETPYCMIPSLLTAVLSPSKRRRAVPQLVPTRKDKKAAVSQLVPTRNGNKAAPLQTRKWPRYSLDHVSVPDCPLPLVELLVTEYRSRNKRRGYKQAESAVRRVWKEAPDKVKEKLPSLECENYDELIQEWRDRYLRPDLWVPVVVSHKKLSNGAPVQPVKGVRSATRSRRLPQAKIRPEPFSGGEKWRVPESDQGLELFGDCYVEKTILRLADDDRKNKTTETTLLDHLLQHRIKTVDIKMHSGHKLYDKTIETKDGCWTLVSCKNYDENTGFSFGKSKFVRIVYAKVSAPGLKPFSIEDYLLRLADFTRLKPRKIAARLEHLQSPTNKQIAFLDTSDFMEIPDKGYVGGGFISEVKLVEILNRAGMSLPTAKRVTAIQVRIIIPAMGLYKGMLIKKRSKGGAPIELPWSMKKVPKSTHPEAFKRAALVICKIGTHPSPSSANDYIGKKLDPNIADPSEKSFTEKIRKPLTDMVLRLWRTMGVPEKLCMEYQEESRTIDRHNHGWLVGVPDPTNALPPDTIFVPGFKQFRPSEFFVTRSPCYAYEHGRKLPMVSSKPDAMSNEDWEWLNKELTFGVIIFSNPREGMKSIPERIANGDLDGDLYVVCWDEKILGAIHSAPLEDEPSDDDGKLVTGVSDPDWFSKTQRFLTDGALNNELGRLTGILYKRGEKVADKSELKLKDPDANAFYEAYNQALEFKKHGRRITLPSHLVEKIPANLRHLVSDL